MTVPGRFSVVPAVYLFLLRPARPADGSEVLLQLRQGTGFMDGHWAAAVAGHVEKGESVYDALDREATEEVGVRDIDPVPWCAMQRSRRTGDPVDERVDYFFTTTAWTGTPRILEPHKCAGLRWCRLDALDTLPGPVVPHERQVLESLRVGRTPPIVTFGFGAG